MMMESILDGAAKQQDQTIAMVRFHLRSEKERILKDRLIFSQRNKNFLMFFSES